MMKVIETPISPFLQNAPIAFCEETRESIFIDPGDEIERLMDTSSSKCLKRIWKKSGKFRKYSKSF